MMPFERLAFFRFKKMRAKQTSRWIVILLAGVVICRSVSAKSLLSLGLWFEEASFLFWTKVSHSQNTVSLES